MILKTMEVVEFDAGGHKHWKLVTIYKVFGMTLIRVEAYGGCLQANAVHFVAMPTGERLQ